LVGLGVVPASPFPVGEANEEGKGAGGLGPAIASALRASAELGRRVASLLDTETPVPGVTSGEIRDDLRGIAVLTAPNNAADFHVSAGWGHKGQGGVTMPGRGRVAPHTQRIPTADSRTGTDLDKADERASTASVLPSPSGRGAGGEGPVAGSPSPALPLVAPPQPLSLDIYLNATTYWSNVPVRVWEYTIGGYQVMKKWLSYREESILNRPITSKEAIEVTNMARRIAALVSMEAELNANYRAILALDRKTEA